MKKVVIMDKGQKAQAEDIWDRIQRGETVTFEERRGFLTGTVRYHQLDTLDVLLDIQERMNKLSK